MNDPKLPEEPQPDLDKSRVVESSGNVATPESPKPGDAGDSTASQQKTSQQLTPEEQMALYEKELKESDWGHQPC